MPTLQLAVQRIGNYSYLALENLSITGLTASGASPAGGPAPPPLNDPVLGTPPTGTQTTQPLSAAQQAAQLIGRSWGGWCLAVYNLLRTIAPAAAGQNQVAVMIEAPSVDETDVEWYAKLGAAVGVTNPLVFTPSFTVAKSRYGRTFQIGDYVLIADSNTTAGVYNFEIAQLTAISGAGAWTLTRAQFGTPLVAHAPGLAGFIPIYRLIDAFWSIALPAPTVPQVKKLPWDNMCVAAVQASAAGLAPILLNLIPSGASQAVPGFRTLNGNEYTLGNPAAAALGQTSLLRLSCAGFHSIRNIFFEFDGAAPATGPTNITLAYIQPDRLKAYQLATFVIAAGARASYAATALPQARRTPYAGTWPYHANLPLMTGGLSAAGLLQNGFTLDPTKTAAMQEDGEIDYIITLNAGTPGVNLRGTVQS